MGKKVWLSIILFSILSMFAFSSTVGSEIGKSNKTLGMNVSATLNDYHKLTIEPMNNEGIFSSQPVGMPFDLTGDDVKFNPAASYTYGREIAEWSLHTNYARGGKIRITVDAGKMTQVDSMGNASNQSGEIGYYLFFPYRFYSGGNLIEGFFKVHSGQTYSSDNDGSVQNPIATGNYSRIDTGVYPIRFMIDEYTDLSDSSNFPPGTYQADVTVTVEAVNL